MSTDTTVRTTVSHRAFTSRFRIHALNDPAPTQGRLVGVCAWAAGLSLGGLAVALRALVGFVTTDAGWYGPSIFTVGIVGIMCTIGSLASVHRRRLPWLLLTAASAMVTTCWFVTGAVA